MRTFEDGFFPDMPFTLFMPIVTNMTLYVAEEREMRARIDALNLTKDAK